MIITRYSLENGIEIPAAAITLRSASMHSSSVMIDGEILDSKSLLCTFDIFANESARTDGRPPVSSIERVYPYDETKNLEDQAYANLEAEV
jgi:hypothetical protein